MSNFFKNITLSVKPSDNTQWDNDQNTYSVIYSKTAEDATPVITGANSLWPEQNYVFSVESATDKYDNDVSTSVTIPQDPSFTTKNDYPAFRYFNRGRFITNSENFKFKETEVDPTSYDISEGTTVGDSTPTISSAASILNASHLNSNSFEVHKFTNYGETNLYDKDWNILHSDTGQIIMGGDPIKEYFAKTSSISILEDRSLYNFSAFNIRLGIHRVRARYSPYTGHETYVTDNPVSGEVTRTLNNDDSTHGYFIDNESISTPGSNILPAHDFSENTAIDDQYIPGIVTSQAGLKLYHPGASSDDKQIFLYVTEDNPGYDTFQTIEIEATSKSKKQSGSESKSKSYIDYFKFCPPLIKMKKKPYNGNEEEVSNTTNSNTLDSIYPTSITFSNFNDWSSLDSGIQEGGIFSFTATTNENRPFLALVDHDLNTSNGLIGRSDVHINQGVTTQINSIVTDQSVLACLDSAERRTPFIIEMLSDSYDSDIVTPSDFTNPIDENTTIGNRHWVAIGATPSTIDNKETYIENYFQFASNNKIDGLKYPSSGISEAPVILQNNIHTSSTKTNTITWPAEGIDRSSSINIHGSSSQQKFTLANLIPGKYYAFRVSAANFAGTTSKIFNIKTSGNPAAPSFSSSLEIDGVTYQNGGNITLTSSPNIRSFTLSGQITGGSCAESSENLTIKDGSDNVLNTGTTTSVSRLDSQVFDNTSITYTYKVVSNSWYIQNAPHTSDYILFTPVTHTYTINVTAAPTANVTTGAPTSPSATGFTMNGSASASGGNTATDMGFIFSGAGTHISDPGDNSPSSTAYTSQSCGTTNPFNYARNGLVAGTYYYRAYLEYTGIDNQTHYVYGAEQSQLVEGNPNINIDITGITRTTAGISFTQQ